VILRMSSSMAIPSKYNPIWTQMNADFQDQKESHIKVLRTKKVSLCGGRALWCFLLL
jgi:hypothetical protein